MFLLLKSVKNRLDELNSVGLVGLLLFFNTTYSVQFGNASYMVLILNAGGQGQRVFCSWKRGRA